MATGIKMALVFALLGGTLWFLRRHDRSSLVSARRAERPVALLAQAKVGKTSSVALVRIGAESYAVGVTEQRVTLLVDHPIELAGPSDEADDAGDASDSDDAGTSFAAPPATLGGVLRNLVGRRPQVHYLDVTLPVQTRPQDRSSVSNSGTDGYGSGHIAGMPEPVRRR